MKCKFLIFLMLAFSPILANAQSLSEVFVAMPDSMISYLDQSMRKSLVDDAATKKSSVVVNAIGDTTKLEVLSADYLKLICNKARTLEMKLLPRANEGDTILCLVNTYKGPAEESTIDFYNKDWQKLDKGNFIETIAPQSLLHKPDSISNSDYSQLCDMLDPLLVNISLSPKDQSAVFSISLGDVPTDKKEQVKALILQRKLNWNGEKYN